MIVAAIVVVVGSLLACGWKFLHWIWLKPKKLEKQLREQGLAGSSYRLLFGDSKDMTIAMREARLQSMNFSHDVAHRAVPHVHLTTNKYGNDSFVWIGPTPRVYITDPEQLKIVYSQFNDIPKTPIFPSASNLGGGLFSLEGSKWAKHRKIINPAFHMEKLKDMFPAFSESCNELIIKWEKMASSKEAAESFELDVWPDLQSLTVDVISRTAFGSNFEEGSKIFHCLNHWVELLMTTLTKKIYNIPGWRSIPTKLNRKMGEISREIRTTVCGIISKRQRAMEAGEVSNATDLLGCLLESNSNQVRDQDNKKDAGMSMEDIIGECRLFYFAGQETTAALLVWTMVLLARCSEWQERARAEVLEVFGNDNNNLDFDGLSRLKVVTMVLNEVLRLYPPISVLARVLQKEMKLGNLLLPVGVSIGVPILHIHHDPQFWGEDAREFKPERFSEGISKATKNQFCFMPFGGGPRICIGQNFAMVEAKIALSMILQRFSFELSPSYTHAPVSNVTTQPQHGAHLILRKL